MMTFVTWQVLDCMKRVHQCATVQLDFNLPERFNLQYRGKGTAGKAPSVPAPAASAGGGGGVVGAAAV